MGLLSLGTPLHWSEAKSYADHVRKHGIEQFLHIYNFQKDRETQCLLWGDEVYIKCCIFICQKVYIATFLQIEYIVVKFNDEEKTTKLSLRAFDILETLEKPEHDWLEGIEK